MESPTVLVGQVEEVFHDGKIAKFQWRVPNLSDLTTHVTSPSVTYFDVTWELEIRFYQSFHRVYLSRNHPTDGYLEPVHCSVGYKKADGTEEDLVRDSVMPQNVEVLLLCAFRPSQCVTPSGERILTCTLWKDGSTYEEVVSRMTQVQGASCAGGRVDGRPSKGVSRATQTEDASAADSRIVEDPSKGVSLSTQTDDASCTNGRMNEDQSKALGSLSEHYRNLFLSGDGHDVLLRVGDKQFRAHQHILESRSAVFAAMFGSDMAEGAAGSVTIEDCDPDSFGQFLQFVYSGAVDIASVGSALGLYYAADKYDFQTLKDICVDFLKGSFTTATVFDVVCLAARHGEEELLRRAIVYLSAHLEEVMNTVEWQRFLSDNPILANEMCLKAMNCKRC